VLLITKKHKFLGSNQPYFLENGIPLWITASGGIAEYPSDGLNVEQLLQVADQNMYLTKQSPK
jgi:GGDEF domain-containing protein